MAQVHAHAKGKKKKKTKKHATNIIYLDLHAIFCRPRISFFSLQKYLTGLFSKIYFRSTFKNIFQEYFQKYLYGILSKISFRNTFKNIFQEYFQKYLSGILSKISFRNTFKNIFQEYFPKYISGILSKISFRNTFRVSLARFQFRQKNVWPDILNQTVCKCNQQATKILKS